MARVAVLSAQAPMPRRRPAGMKERGGPSTYSMILPRGTGLCTHLLNSAHLAIPSGLGLVVYRRAAAAPSAGQAPPRATGPNLSAVRTEGSFTHPQPRWHPAIKLSASWSQV